MTGGPQGGAVPVTGIGMVTSVGFGAYPACAAIRAGIVRMNELDKSQRIADRPSWKPPLIGSPLKGLTDGYFGMGRWTRMTVDGLRDLMVNARLGGQEFEQLGIYLGLPSGGGISQERRQQLAARIAQWLQLPGLQSRIRIYSEGHASALKALQDALTQLQQGRFTQAVIGGVDSLVERERLTQLWTEGRLKTDENAVGLIPGEAAAFFLVESPVQARRRKAEVLAWLEAPSVAHEPVSPASGQPCNGLGLGRAISTTLVGLTDRGAHTGLILSDLNGELYRAEEFSKMVPRALQHLQQPWRLWHPADCIGDTGAASSAISVCVGARALARGYAGTDNVLVCASSDEGLRGSVYLRSARKEGARP
ncbi:beta-ketoacyl synthase N-terminal-like domain-containing protein [Archangium lansingense]|uniref:Beta-ketoacyl synthase N-terminal-like domain-containing protein n=1 Tax=Archangium lansingense TaxID=2995310 RepID=A0ABT4AGI6_9BACT|nr:beta-ketoacyl synthase N-terminal-like domain-containing protein [Archangium lansinium]MCY1080755.1 beta-ketoacyl synthase N-terminal-like domain-containing protein [Archangium lansinium]